MTQYGINTLDLPSLSRHAIGFERMIHDLNRTFANVRGSENYPPYNVIQHDDSHYTVEVAVSGFEESELDVELTDRVLTISGEKRTKTDSAGYIHKGISTRTFTRNFTLADNVEVKLATVKNGILSVDLELIIPEEQRPKKIAITFTK
jgi:molecular chaperone IbpA